VIGRGPVQRLRCRWTRRRLQRYLDKDPAALLVAAEAERVRAHLERCGPCHELEEQFVQLGRLLAAQRSSAAPGDDEVERVRARALARIGGS
jgi:predicted anti-sigma-YlaC factor YlaD